MIAIAGTRKSKVSSRQRNDKFLSMLPAIQKQAAFAFREFAVEPREELIQEVVATAYGMFHQLVLMGKMSLAYAAPLAQFPTRHVRAGRRMGSQRNSRDVTSRGAPLSLGIRIRTLDQFNARTGQWREVLVEDRRTGPAETAAARIDCAAWLRSLSNRQRAIARVLARGGSTRR